MSTIIQDIGTIFDNRIYIKREDLIPFSFGGNKARKAELFFKEIDKGDYDYVVTYGSSSSNHCRVIANACASRNMGCFIISPLEASEDTMNSKMMKLFGAEITIVPVTEVSETINSKLSQLKKSGLKPYFIPGGGHGNIGTQAYVECYDEIVNFPIKFDYVFFASGTGTTHAGLVAGKMIRNGKENIVGISIARKNPQGRQVVVDSIKDYLSDRFRDELIEKQTVFVDKYVGDGYGVSNNGVMLTIKEMLINHGIQLDATYTGKAFYGMKRFIIENGISRRNILFIHTGGTPLFFDILDKL